MKINDGMTRRFAKFAVLLMVGGSMSANAGLFGFGDNKKWKEEVQLSDGRVIVVERELLTESGGDEWAVNRSGSKPKEHRIKFEYPAGQLVEWRSIKKSPQTWPEIPLIFDMDAGQPVVFSSVFISGGCQVYSKYLYRSGAWIEEPLPPKFEQRATNLLIFSNRENFSLINLETKRKKNSDVRAQDFKQVGPKHPYCR